MKRKVRGKIKEGKKRFAHEFAILAILVVSVGILFFYSSINFTGFAVFSEYENQTSCETAGYTWEEITEQNCTTTTTCVNETINCEPCTAYEDINGTQGNCISWSSCIEETCTDNEECAAVVVGGQCTGDVCDSSHLGLCLDEPACTGASGYWYDDICNAQAQCTPNTCSSLEYNCEIWSDGCGGTLDCGICDSGYSCNSGVCTAEESSEDSSEESSEESTDIQIPVTAQAIEPICTSNWQCGEWQECVEGNQIRVCTDLGECNSEEGIPETSQACIVPIVETCSDGIKNQNETGIDCGGSSCKKCSFFTIMGNTIAGTFDVGRKLLLEGWNLTKILISVGVLVFIIGGLILTFFFFKKKGKTSKKFVKGDIQKLDQIIDNLPK